jgi:hypothetical protein
MGKDVPKDENGLRLAANITSGEMKFQKVVNLIEVDLVNALTEFYQRTKSLKFKLGENDTFISSEAYFKDDKINNAKNICENIETAYKALNNWYWKSLSAAAALQDKEKEPEKIKISKYIDGKWVYTEEGKDEDISTSGFSDIYTKLFKNLFKSISLLLVIALCLISFTACKKDKNELTNR